MVFDSSRFPRVLTIYLELSNYPTLAPQIRERMRREMFQRKVISPKDFEREVLEKAIQSQQREGLVDPLSEEPPDVWANRLAIIRDHQTDFYFAYNLPHDLFEQILRKALEKRMPPQDVVLTFHPELAPWEILFAQGESYEALPPEELRPVVHHLQEIKVVLIKAMISDHLEYVGIAKEWFDISDLQAIRAQRVGRGKIGGKAAGVMLAETILRKSNRPELTKRIRIPRSWFLGANVFYQFTQINELLRYINQKYRTEQEIREEYPSICEIFRKGTFPDDIIAELQSILVELGDLPLIVRSSSLLEDSFGTSFAGKYDSFFCPNQGTPEENIKALLFAISSVYASVYSPDVILYRRRMRLLDYDERMAILIQEVKGRHRGEYFFPDGAGVGFSQNQFRWDPRIDREAGFLRLVWGLGTRAVDRLSTDYPRFVALSHPDFRPEVDPNRIKRYSQHFVDLIHLDSNTFKSFPLSDVVKGNTPSLRLLAQHFSDGHFSDYVGIPVDFNSNEVVLTFDGLLRKTDFTDLIKEMLQTLENAYKRPVDTEFVLDLSQQVDGKPKPIIDLLQCRPQSHLPVEVIDLPEEIPDEERVFSIQGLVSDGLVDQIRYVVYVNGETYYRLDPIDQKQIARLIGHLNSQLEGEKFILIGPGRWGSVNSEMGVSVTYADLYNASALIEVVSDKAAIEPSYGTHFFQDLVEARIFILAIALDDPQTEFNQSFFIDSKNSLEEIVPNEADWSEIVKVIDIPLKSDGKLLELAMNGEAGRALAYVKHY